MNRVYDDLDFTHAQRTFADTFQGVSIRALHKGLQSVGVKDNEAIIYSELMDGKALWLTANADTIYVVGALDLTKGPMVLETAPGFLGGAMVNVGVRLSGGSLLLGSLNGFAVVEAHALDHLGEALRAVQPAPVPLGRLRELEDHRQCRLTG